MSQATFSVRMDETLKKQFELLCNSFGMNMSTAINVFARAVVREHKIPFEISDTTSTISVEMPTTVSKSAKNSTAISDPSIMTIEEIDNKISKLNREQ